MERQKSKQQDGDDSHVFRKGELVVAAIVLLPSIPINDFGGGGVNHLKERKRKRFISPFLPGKDEVEDREKRRTFCKNETINKAYTQTSVSRRLL